ncbi:hypothetical protein ACFFX1_34240 [Dactylosporangium sucinum]|uniref:TrbL/VirB6 plasmid conjugal transfer protein n=1 Tax=Dactylosporangium sucinum TaxID=1424081 RepID=A0A917X8J2_9ACTN|nr:hypothetical protein [Dactylosporangium sucinum]GGM88089.1 hypothetical protein GCM10007977_107570 [Dactylosporangium sucinum]
MTCKTDALAERMQLLLAPMPPGMSAVLVITVGFLALLASLTQAMLLLFRNGAIIILAGMLQLAASGTFTAGTSNWLRRVLGWLLALVFYEPFAATSYGVAFMLVGDRANKDIATWLTGIGMLVLSLVALPAMMRFFNWTVGAVQQAGNSGGMLAAAGAAGLHAVAAHRGASGYGATEYARDMTRRNPPSPSGGTGSGAPKPTPPTFTGPAPAAGAAAGSATTAAAAATSAAAGPAAPVVAGVVLGAKVVGSAARAAARAAQQE